MPLLKAPEGATNCSHNGEVYEVDTDGNVDVPAEAVADLVDHGFSTKLDGPTDLRKGGRK